MSRITIGPAFSLTIRTLNFLIDVPDGSVLTRKQSRIHIKIKTGTIISPSLCLSPNTIEGQGRLLVTKIMTETFTAFMKTLIHFEPLQTPRIIRPVYLIQSVCWMVWILAVDWQDVINAPLIKTLLWELSCFRLVDFNLCSDAWLECSPHDNLNSNRNTFQLDIHEMFSTWKR